ncbi:MAG TPA: FoF1 ATP synthase subunit gamma [Xanthobacteraceae bacterium]|nr:FoF1 ATP synthase subunit gamma [Xanthobacteraceae bacterium]
MSERLADVAAQIRNMRQLEAVVTAMRGIAASRAQRARALLAGVDAYSAVVSHAIGQALALLPADVRHALARRAGKPGLVLFCAEQGFAGAFSERLLAAPTREERAGAAIFLIGTRGTVVASELGLEAAWSTPMATQVEAIPALANRIADALYGGIAAAALSRVDIIVARATPEGPIRIDRHALLPVDLARFARPATALPPLTNLPPELLIERLISEYVYAQLCAAAMHAFEAENEARMLAMASARSNIETKLTSLASRERRLRQEEITTEVVELAAGAEALRAGRR